MLFVWWFVCCVLCLFGVVDGCILGLFCYGNSF